MKNIVCCEWMKSYENNPNWQDINLGLDLFEANNTDVSEAREFVAFCQKEMEE